LDDKPSALRCVIDVLDSDLDSQQSEVDIKQGKIYTTVEFIKQIRQK